ncbi:alpha-amylase family glycosyl hydrolase [Marilutibacter spongiae]|uniref:Glycosyl hydrolase family 13 catalytic domain-containing protein n=1 Tax=Marilutibacter spongiae TaxID=2025720 RepID=A0A7W3TPM0_9GAMM|nr:hypothetical protein [Lysobacter spongiae]
MLAVVALLQAGSAMSAGVVAPPGDDAGLHVTSPDWRDQVVYFAMIDRFDDGDPGNNDQGAGEYDPADGSRYSGGDLRGLARRLDYMQQLGATALWITPPVANQWLNPSASFSGYHGYWASDFSAVDAHYGRIDDYRALARALHGRGMYLVQDVVVNHVGDFLACEPPAPGAPEQNCRVRSDPTGHAAPVQSPFDRNDPRDPAQRDAGIYHWTPAIADYTDRRQELDHQLAGLDDLDTENPVVRRALRKAYGDWIRDVGVDAFRVDTAFHVPADYFSDFMQASDPDAPGMVAVAAATGRQDFLAFGEGFGVDAPFDDTRARKLDAYMRTPGGLPSMINFPLYGALGDVFARGRPTAQLAHRIRTMMALHADPWRMPTFVDNHDVDRFLAGGSEAGLKQALLAMLTLPGIPVIYYGTEQGFLAQRPAMFATGFGSHGRDHFDTSAPLYTYLQRAIALRRGDTLFSRGTPVVLADNPARSGAIAWRIDGEGGRHALVAFNSAATPMLLDRVATGLPAGTPLRSAFAIEGAPRDLLVGADGTISVVLPVHGGEVWRAGSVSTPGKAGAPLPRGEAFLPRLQMDPVPAVIRGSEQIVHGRAEGVARIQLLVDGDLGHAQTIQVGTDGRWQARLRTDGMIDPDRVHRLLARDPLTGATSDPAAFRVALDWHLLADRDDPVGDDTGPNGRYRYPSDPGWRERHPADIHRVRAWRAGGALRLEIGMAGISQAWHPANGFDHVAFTAYLSLPGRDDGTAVMPQQAARLPGDRCWQYRWRAHGWSNLLTRAEGADAQDEGETVTPGPSLRVDAAAGTVTVTFPANAFDGIDSLDGAVVYLTTWDYDGGYRALAPEAGPVQFGGGAPDDPRIMDAIDVALDRDASR